MKKLLIIATVLFTVLSFSSCKEDSPIPMIWEFSDYDREVVSAVYSPDFINQVAIVASADYSGDITLKCTNYPQLALNANNSDGTFKSAEAGFSVKKIDKSTFKITFEPIDATSEKEACDIVYIDGKNGKDSNVTNMSVKRIIK